MAMTDPSSRASADSARTEESLSITEGSTSVPQPEHDDVRGLTTGECGNFAEIEIESEDDTAFFASLRNNVRIFESL